MAETEKVTINLSVVDLGQIDLLVNQGFYSSRSDLIRTAIRNQLGTHAATVDDLVVRQQMAVGIVAYTRRGLEERRAAGEQLDIKVLGMVNIARDVPPELARHTIRSLQVHGVLRASDEVKTALADRMG